MMYRANIPPILHSDATGELFRQCISCEKNLLDDDEPYVIEKAMKRYDSHDVVDTLFEYALCMKCVTNMMRSLSEASLKQIEEYFANNVDLNARAIKLFTQQRFSIDDWLGECVVSERKRETLSEYQFGAICVGDSILFTTSLPYLISGEVADEIASLLSNETLGEIDGFIGDHFGLPPEFEDLPRIRPVPLL